jgi:hypothetical protein
VSLDQAQERLSHAREVIRLLLKAHKMRRLYDAPHAYCVAATGELAASIRAFGRLHQTLRFEVKRDALVFDDTRVYEEANREANIAFGIFLGGVRSIAFHDVDGDELTDLLGMLADRRDDKDIAAALWERELTTIDCVCLDELSEGWDAPEDLPHEALERLREMNERADRIIDGLKRRKLLGEGGVLYEVTDTAEEFERLDAVPLDDRDRGPLDDLGHGAAERIRSFLEQAQAYDHAALLSRMVEVAQDGLALRPDAIGAQGAAWLLEEAPSAALRRNDLSLYVDLLSRYGELRPDADPAVARPLDRALEAASAAERLDALVAMGTSGTAGPAAFCKLLRLLGKAGVAPAVTAYLKASGAELHAALNRLLSEQVALAPMELGRLLAPEAPAETARWALFLASKNLTVEAAEPLYQLGRLHPAKEAHEYANFLWRTTTTQGRLRAFLDALDAPDVPERLRAATTIGRTRDPTAAEAIKKVINDPSFLGRTLEEKQAFFSAAIALDPERAKEFLLQQTLRQGGLMRKGQAAEVKELAETHLRRLNQGKK